MLIQCQPYCQICSGLFIRILFLQEASTEWSIELISKWWNIRVHVFNDKSYLIFVFQISDCKQ